MQSYSCSIHFVRIYKVKIKFSIYLASEYEYECCLKYHIANTNDARLKTDNLLLRDYTETFNFIFP